MLHINDSFRVCEAEVTRERRRGQTMLREGGGRNRYYVLTTRLRCVTDVSEVEAHLNGNDFLVVVARRRQGGFTPPNVHVCVCLRGGEEGGTMMFDNVETQLRLIEPPHVRTRRRSKWISTLGAVENHYYKRAPLRYRSVRLFKNTQILLLLKSIYHPLPPPVSTYILHDT